MVVIGGMGHIPGVILGAVLLSVLPEALRYMGFISDWQQHALVMCTSTAASCVSSSMPWP
jgi:amino acid/amide ABC transporter membrane protein 2, HAAT family (TC 3.A.1.4.-)